MKKLILFLFSINLVILGVSQMPSKRIDSVVKLIESKKTLTTKTVADTFPTANPNVVDIESVKFFSSRNKLEKVVFSAYYHRKDSAKNNYPTDHDVFYFSNDLLIKVVSKDFDQSPPKDLPLYLNEKHQKKYLAKETQHFSKFEGVNYFVELGYNLLNEFKFLTKNK